MKSALLNRIVIFVLLAFIPISQSWGAAGIVFFVTGDVRIVGKTGERKAEKGGEFEADESIVSGSNGMAQLRMSDGASVTVRANAKFHIGQYNGTTGSSKKSGLSIKIEGVFRDVTGAITSFHPENIKMETLTAPIGIRGTLPAPPVAAPPPPPPPVH